MSLFQILKHRIQLALEQYIFPERTCLLYVGDVHFDYPAYMLYSCKRFLRNNIFNTQYEMFLQCNTQKREQYSACTRKRCETFTVLYPDAYHTKTKLLVSL